MNKVVVAAIAVLLLMTGHASAQPCGGYEVTAIVSMEKCPPFGIPPVVPFGVNEEGWMVGFFQPCVIGPDRAFLWTPDGGLVVIPMPDGTSRSRGLAINGSKVVGWFENPKELGTTGFLYDYETDQFTSLGTLPGGNTSEAHGINSAGEIAGFWGDVVNGPFPQAFLWRKGEMIDIHQDFGTAKSRALAINANGLVTGWMGDSQLNEARAFVWDNGKVTQLPPLPEGITSEGWALNCHLDVVGRGRFFDPELNAIVWRAYAYVGGQAFHLDPLPGPSHSNARDINNTQTVVGSSNSRAFIWQDGLLTDLNDLITPLFNGDIEVASGINHIGQIIARAHSDDLNATVGLLLSPINEEILGDLDNDGQVGASDLLILLASWGPCDQCGECPADLNSDGVVGAADLLILLANWG